MNRDRYWTKWMNYCVMLVLRSKIFYISTTEAGVKFMATSILQLLLAKAVFRSLLLNMTVLSWLILCMLLLLGFYYGFHRHLYCRIQFVIKISSRSFCNDPLLKWRGRSRILIVGRVNTMSCYPVYKLLSLGALKKGTPQWKVLSHAFILCCNC